MRRTEELTKFCRIGSNYVRKMRSVCAGATFVPVYMYRRDCREIVSRKNAVSAWPPIPEQYLCSLVVSFLAVCVVRVLVSTEVVCDPETPESA